MSQDGPNRAVGAAAHDGGQVLSAEEFARQYGERVDSIFPNPGGGIYSAALVPADAAEAREISSWIAKATGIEQPA